MNEDTWDNEGGAVLPPLEHDEWCQGGHVLGYSTCWQVARMRWLNKLDPYDCPVGRHGFGYHCWDNSDGRDTPADDAPCVYNCGAVWADVKAERGVETLEHYLGTLRRSKSV